MRYYTQLADIARGTGFPVVEQPGWKTRGKDSLGRPSGMADIIGGVLCHHTATTTTGGDYPSLRTVTYGRVGLVNALSNFGLGRSGTIYVIAAGQTWHAGTVNDQRFSNPQAIGIEAENNGVGERWGAAMLESYARLCAGLCRAFRLDPYDQVRGHKEVRLPLGAKIDPSFDMPAFRRVVAARLANQSGEFVMDQDARDYLRAMEDRINARLGVIDANSVARFAALTAAIDADPDNPVDQAMLNEAVKQGLDGMEIAVKAMTEDTPA